jgi:hypothetical protein
MKQLSSSAADVRASIPRFLFFDRIGSCKNPGKRSWHFAGVHRAKATFAVSKGSKMTLPGKDVREQARDFVGLPAYGHGNIRVQFLSPAMGRKAAMKL